MLLGIYDSDDEVAAAAEQEAEKQSIAAEAIVSFEANAGNPQAAARTTKKPPPGGRAAARRANQTCDEGKVASEVHGRACQCEDCKSLLARFCGKSLQVKGIRFKCKLCSEVMQKKDESTDHFLLRHADELQAFKKQKDPALFESKKNKAELFAAKFSFKRDDVLGKRKHIDDKDVSFGEWTKKEKPEPPPCETEEYQLQMQQVADNAITAPPWMNQPTPTTEGASATDLEVERKVHIAQMSRFCSRNILPVRADEVRCKLCYKTLANTHIAEKHVIEEHQAEFNKEGEIWNRFLHTTARRQPPFGWVCKVCNLFFPTDHAVFVHLGKEVFIRKETRHADTWHQKEDRWGHEEEEECCGDGMNISGRLSYDSVKMFNQEIETLRQQELRADAREAGLGATGDEESDAEEAPGNSNEMGRVVPITEF